MKENDGNVEKQPASVNGVWLKAISVALMTVATLIGATYANRTFLDPRPDAITGTEAEVKFLKLEKNIDTKLRSMYQLISEMKRDLEDADRAIEMNKPPDWTKERIRNLEKSMKKLVPGFDHPDEWGPK